MRVRAPRGDRSAPQLQQTTPTDNDIVTAGTTLTFTFNEAVKAGLGNIEIRYASNNALARTIAITDLSQVSFSGNQVTMVPGSNFAEGTDYYVVIGNGVIRDLANNAFAGISSPTALNFSTRDTTRPEIVDLSPDDDATNVAVDANLVITFNEVVNPGYGYFYIKYANGTLARMIDVRDSTQVTIAGNTVTINPTIDLLSETAYKITFENVIKDLAGNEFGGTGTDGVSFTTGTSLDSVAPVLVTTAPTDNEADFWINPRITLTFDEGVRAGSGNIELRRSSDGGLIETIAVTDPAKVYFLNYSAYIYPSTELDWETQYFLTVAPGAIQDIAGNDFAGFSGSAALDFTTMADPPLVLMGSVPNDNATGWPIDGIVALAFSEYVKPGDGSVLIYRASDNSLIADVDITDTGRVTFFRERVDLDIDVNFDPYTEYYVLVESGAIQDLEGTDWGGITSSTQFSFTTGSLVSPPPSGGGTGSGAGAEGGGIGPDTTEPSLTAISPSDNAANVAINSNIVLTFNEGVQAGAGALRIHSLSDGSLVKTVALSDVSQVQFSGATITINPNTDLSGSTAYYVVLEAGAVEDSAGNPYAGFSSPAAFNFTTASAVSGLTLTGNSFSNTIVGGAGNDTITGLGGKDTLTGAAGSDTFVYGAASHSTSRNYDTITDLDGSSDVLDLWFQVTGVDASITGGSLGLRRFDSDLASAVNGTKLAAHHAVLYTPSSGVPAGSKFLIVDANGVAGYQAGADVVILLGANSTNLGSLTASDFV